MIKFSQIPTNQKMLFAAAAFLAAITFLIWILPILPSSHNIHVEMSVDHYEILDSPGILKLEKWVPTAIGISSGRADVRMPSNYGIRFKCIYFLRFHSFKGLKGV